MLTFPLRCNIPLFFYMNNPLTHARPKSVNFWYRVVFFGSLENHNRYFAMEGELACLLRTQQSTGVLKT